MISCMLRVSNTFNTIFVLPIFTRFVLHPCPCWWSCEFALLLSFLMKIPDIWLIIFSIFSSSSCPLAFVYYFLWLGVRGGSLPLLDLNLPLLLNISSNICLIVTSLSWLLSAFVPVCLMPKLGHKYVRHLPLIWYWWEWAYFNQSLWFATAVCLNFIIFYSHSLPICDIDRSRCYPLCWCLIWLNSW